MNRETVLRLAQESGAKIENWMTNPPKPGLIYMTPEQLEHFAGLVLANVVLKLINETME